MRSSGCWRRPLAGLASILACGGFACTSLAAPEASGARLEAEAPAVGPLRSGQPLTVTLPLGHEVREAILALGRGAPDAEAVVRLSIEGVVTPRAEVAIRVFVHHRAADAETSLDDPRYLGSFTFYPAPAKGEEAAPASYLLDLGGRLRRLPAADRLPDGDRLSLTFVLVPLRQGEKPEEDVAVPIGQVRLVVVPAGAEGL